MGPPVVGMGQTEVSTPAVSSPLTSITVDQEAFLSGQIRTEPRLAVLVPGPGLKRYLSGVANLLLRRMGITVTFAERAPGPEATAQPQ